MSTSHSSIANQATAWDSRSIVVTFQGPAGKSSHLIDKPFVRIGCHPRSEVVLPEGPAKRLYLHGAAGGIYCLSLEHGGLGSPSFSGWMLPRRAISVGPYRISARFADDSMPVAGGESRAASAGAAAPPAQLDLSMINGRRQPLRLRLRRPLTIVGRETPSKLCLADASISRAHCILYWDDARLWVVDLFSANGVRIDDRLVEYGIVHPGSYLVLGNVRLRYVPAAESEWSPPEEDDLETGTTSVVPVRLLGTGPEAPVAPNEDAADSGRAVESGDSTWGRQALVDQIARLKEQLELAQVQQSSDEQGSQTAESTAAPATEDWEAIVDELRREAQQQAEEALQRRGELLTGLESVRAELAEIKRERDLAQSRLERAEHACAVATARLSELEQQHAAREAELAAALQREAQYQRELDELTALRHADLEAVQRQLAELETQRETLAVQLDQLRSREPVEPPLDNADHGAPESPFCEDEHARAETEPAPRFSLPIDMPLLPPPESSIPPHEAIDSEIGDPAIIESPRHGALTPAAAVNREPVEWRPPALVTADPRRAWHAADADANVDTAAPADILAEPRGPLSEPVLPRTTRLTTLAPSEDELFDQLVSTQARHAGAQRRRRLLATLAVGGVLAGVLAVAGYWAWQPLARLLGS